MISAFKRFLKESAASKSFNQLDSEFREIVFYSEGAQDWPHYEPMVSYLINHTSQKFCYVSSDAKDPGLSIESPNIRSFNIGDATVRTLWFKTLQAMVLVMSVPELEKYQLKRSAYPVHYIYAFHSINSTHMVYREQAFDHYDTVFCVGPHHRAEILASEKLYQLKPKNLVSHGSCRLDTIIKSFKNNPVQKNSSDLIQVVLAPSWGKGSFIEEGQGHQLIPHLVESQIRVSLRLHPMTLRHNPEFVANLQKDFANLPSDLFELVTDMNNLSSLHQSDVMITDWSGAAYEFAFGLERPVLFVDTQPKMNNPKYGELNITPLEVGIRHDLGGLIPLDDLRGTAQKIRNLCTDSHEIKEQIRKVRDQWVYNVEQSGEIGAKEIIKIRDQVRDA
jgi:YidC/Oxa1 family membrane protein insertase